MSDTLTVEKYYHIVINEDDKMVVGILRGGAVEFGEGFTADEAAKKFWEILGKSHPGVLT